MKIDHSVKEATRLVALGTLICSLLMQGVYALVAILADGIPYSYTFPLGNLLMAPVMVLNFFLMSLAMQKTVEEGGDAARVRARVRISYLLRSLLFIAALVVGLLVPCFHPLSVILTVVFPQLSIIVSSVYLNRRHPDPPAPARPVSDTVGWEDDPEEEPLSGGSTPHEEREDRPHE